MVILFYCCIADSALYLDFEFEFGCYMHFAVDNIFTSSAKLQASARGPLWLVRTLLVFDGTKLLPCPPAFCYLFLASLHVVLPQVFWLARADVTCH